jgi:hypothetical protein
MSVWRPWTAAAVALVLLNVSVTFHSLWPSPGIKWQGAVSVELSLCLLALAIAARNSEAVPARATRWLAAGWMALTVGRYAEVTAPALYGRDINLYWDLRYMPDVAAMLVRAAPIWLVVTVCAAAALALWGLFAAFQWAFKQTADALSRRRGRIALGSLSATAAVLFALQQASLFSAGPSFSTPVVQTYLRQARLVVDAVARPRSVPPSPATDSDLAFVSGADVLLVFIESYGAVSYDNRTFADALTPARAGLESAIRETGRRAVSAYVESPTFGGVSWLAHISLMSGIEVRDPDMNALVMTQERDTLVTTFSRRGYRTVAAMPGLWQSWPEGSFYGFDAVYGGSRLDYRGPQFGWFSLTDQYALAKLDALELAPRSRRPVFVFFPTISTHVPFTPTPPYQPDWPRMLTDRPYDAEPINEAFEQVPDWLNLGPGYVNALSYAYATLAGYLRLRADRDVVLVLVGDHQPPAAVTGEGARWDVPVHVIASRREVLDRLKSRGFRQGLAPDARPLARMHLLLPILLEAFGN